MPHQAITTPTTATAAATARRSCPPAGWVTGEQAQRLFGLSQWTWDKWIKAGQIRCGQPIGPSGRFKHYRVEELRRVIAALRAPQAFPPPGMVDAEQARRMFGVSTWMWSKWMKQRVIRCGQWMLNPAARRTKLYPTEELRRVIEELRNTGPFPPPGWVDGDGAARRFGVARLTWKSWVVQGKVPRGTWFVKPGGGQCYLYPEDDLKRLMEQLRGSDKAYWDPENPGYYHIPPGFVRQRDAWRMFGVDRGTWKRWEREGQITCGTRVHRGGPKLYKLEDLQRLLEEYGRYAPPYPDPDRPGCYRVPLSGYDIRRREAIIDAADLPLVQGRRWGWCPHATDAPPGGGYVAHSKQADTTPLHRIMMGISDPALRVVHLNNDPLDCRRANLAVKTVQQQVHGNRPMRAVAGRPVTSKYKGVCWDKRRGKWVAQIRKAGVHRHIGRFDDELAAAEAYDELARELFGAHAYLNFPDGIDAALERQAAA